MRLYDDVPAARFEAGSRREKSFLAGCQVDGAPVRKAVEFYQLQGGMAQYALIGGQFEPAPVDSLTVRVDVSPPEQRDNAPSREALTSVFARLPEDVVDHVLEGIADYQRHDVLPGGLLTIDRCATSELDTSPFAVRHTAGVLIAVITATVRDEDVEHALNRWYLPPI